MKVLTQKVFIVDTVSVFACMSTLTCFYLFNVIHTYFYIYRSKYNKFSFVFSENEKIFTLLSFILFNVMVCFILAYC